MKTAIVILGEHFIFFLEQLADLTMSKRAGTSFQIEIHFTIFNRFYLLFSFTKRVET